MCLTMQYALKAVCFGWIGIVSAISQVSSKIDVSDFPANSIIWRDVAIIGGGSTGTYSAINLRDMGKSVVVVEAKDRLGGHTETYTDPATNITIDIGVVLFQNLSVVRDYFARFNIPLERVGSSSPGLVTEYVDFRTGKIVSGYSPPSPSAALAAYGVQVAKYPALENGFYLPEPVPVDLLLPIGDFVQKYDLGSAVNLIFFFAQGLGDLLRQPTVYVFKNFGLGVLTDLATGFLTSAHHDNSELYEKATTELGADVLLNSNIVAMDRSSNSSVKIIVNTASGLKLILSQKVIMTIPPKLDNLFGWDLSIQEIALFSQFNNSAYYTSLLRDTGIPDNVSFVNVGVDTAYDLPVFPGAYKIQPTSVPGLRIIMYGSATALSNDHVKANIISTVQRLHSAGKVTEPVTTPEFAIFSSHTPFELTVSPDAIQNGFYTQLYGLQGERNTFYTGAAFHTQNSALLWQFTQALLPSVVGNLTAS